VADVVVRLRAAGCVFAEDEAALLVEAAAGPALEQLVARRVAGEPLEQLLGWASFGGLRVAVVPGVFVPRRRTELLAREAVAVTAPGSVVVDLCCGCGAVGLVVATAVPDVELHAADVDPVAVACARTNLAAVGGTVHEGDLDGALPTTLRGRVAVLTANTPYVPTAEIALMPPEAREHEPAVALDGGADGLAVARRVVAVATGWLAPGGHVLLETSRRQAPVLAAAVAAAGLAPRVVTDDDLGGTVVLGHRPELHDHRGP
jgi:release factor glutamine methyltransferase